MARLASRPSVPVGNTLELGKKLIAIYAMAWVTSLPGHERHGGGAFSSLG